MDNTLRQKLLDAHIQFELDKFNSENIDSSIRKELSNLLDYSMDKKVSQIFPPEKSKERIQYLIENNSLNEEVIELLRKAIKVNYEFLSEDIKSISEVIDKDEFFKVVRDAVGLKKAREKVINFVVHSSAYSRMMTGIIYAAIKDFLVQNPLTKDNPLATSFFKIGQDFLNNLPGMQGNFDTTITEFLRNSIAGRIKQSEELILEELDSNKNMDDLLNEIWETMEKISIPEIKSMLPEEEVIKYIQRMPIFWEHLKKSKFVERFTLHHWERFYVLYGDKTISEILKELSIEKEWIINYSTPLLVSALDNESIRLP